MGNPSSQWATPSIGGEGAQPAPIRLPGCSPDGMIRPVNSPYAQDGFGVGFDWGPVAAGVVPGDIVAVVDVLSCTTAVTVAAVQGIVVYPYRWRDETAVACAEQYDAVLAVGRSEAGPGGVSLSPGTIRRAKT